MNLKYVILFYLILMALLFSLKPHIFDLNVDKKKRKFMYLIFLVIIIAIISFYIKILFEYFMK